MLVTYLFVWGRYSWVSLPQSNVLGPILLQGIFLVEWTSPQRWFDIFVASWGPFPSWVLSFVAVTVFFVPAAARSVTPGGSVKSGSFSLIAIAGPRSSHWYQRPALPLLLPQHLRALLNQRLWRLRRHYRSPSFLLSVGLLWLLVNPHRHYQLPKHQLPTGPDFLPIASSSARAHAATRWSSGTLELHIVR